MRAIAFNGSPRSTGNTVFLLQKVLGVLQQNGIETELFQIGGERLHGCTACVKCAQNQDQQCVITSDNLNDYLAEMIAADAIIVGSPTYFADISAETKALLDRSCFVALQNNGLFKNKVGAAVAAVRRGGAVHAVDTMLKPFQMSQMLLPGSTYWNIGFGLQEQDVSDDEEGIANMENLGRQIAYVLKLQELGKQEGVENALV